MLRLESIESRLFINNEFVPSTSGKKFTISNPYTDQQICSVYEASKEDVDLAVDAAEAAFETWSDLAAHERAMYMFRFAQLVMRDAQELAELDSMCMGKPIELLKKMDVPALVGVFNYFAGSGYHILGESSLNSPNFLNVSVRQPYGVVGLIIPWNVPMIMFAFKVAPALVCGNTVVLKSSEKAPLSSLKLASLIKEAGFPPGVVNIVSGAGEPTGTAMGLHPRIRKISFTGSVATGRKILHMAADSNLKNVSLELGGKSPAIVCEDADLEVAAKYTHYSIVHNSGQHCQANSRVLVHASVAEKYVDMLKALMAQVTLGDPADPATFQGPQSDYKQLERIERLVDQAVKDGAKVVCGGKRSADTGKGAFMAPTILRDVPTTSEAYQEEIFGPVVIVNTFTSEKEVLREANCTEFGLFASIYTPHLSQAIRLAKHLSSGSVGINVSVPVRAVDMPIGGWRGSGFGTKELSLHGLNTYTELKTVFVKYGEEKADRASLAVGGWHNGHVPSL